MDSLTVVAVDRLSPLQDGEPSFEKSVFTEPERGAFNLDVPPNRRLSLEFYHGLSRLCALLVELAPNEALMLNIDVEPNTSEEYLLSE